MRIHDWLGQATTDHLVAGLILFVIGMIVFVCVTNHVIRVDNDEPSLWARIKSPKNGWSMRSTGKLYDYNSPAVIRKEEEAKA